MSKTRIAKKAVHMIVALNVAAVVNAKVSDYMDLEDESITLEIGSFVAGQLVANQTDKLTEPMVDKIVATWQARRADKADTPVE
jgi:hypothetical protein